MPKMVDPEQRRRHIYDALFDVVAEHGIEHVTLRRVADTAGLAIGSVRHYVDSQAGLLLGAADELIERISARLLRHRDRLDTVPRRADGVSPVVLDMLAELLPLQRDSRREVIVWLELTVASRTTPALRDAAARLFAGSRVFAGIVVERMGAPEPEVATERLAALVDGLAMRAAVFPGEVSAELAHAVVLGYLTQLAATPAGR